MSIGIQPIHIVVILLVALLVFGPKRLPEMGRSIGKMINEFRNSTREMTDVFHEAVNQPVDMQVKNNEPSVNTIRPVPAESLPFQSSFLPPAPAGSFCIQCGAPNLPEAHFCSNCGTKLLEKQL